jgi:PAS domain S-box-containing protein
MRPTYSIIHGYAIAIGITFLGTAIGLSVGNHAEQMVWEKSEAVYSNEHFEEKDPLALERIRAHRLRDRFILGSLLIATICALWIYRRLIWEQNRAYQALQNQLQEKEQTETALQNLIEGTAATTGTDFFPALARHIAEALEVSYALVTEVVDDKLQSLAFWAKGSLQPTFSYVPAKTPCEIALRDGQFYCECLVQKRFPEDLDLVTMGVDSYLGIALKDSTGKAIGNLCILHDQNIQNPQRAEEILRVFAARTAAELERQKANASLRELNHALEAKVKERTTELQRLTERLRVALTSGAIGCWEWNLIENTVVWDDRMYELCGRVQQSDQSNSSEIYEIWANSLHPDDREYAEHFGQQAARGEVEYDAEFRVIHPDGSIHFIKAYGILLRDDDGNPECIIGVNFDISDRKRIELELAESEAKFRCLIEGGIDLIWSTDRDYRFTYLSPQFQSLFGWEPEVWVGRAYQDLVHPEDLPRVMSQGFREDSKLGKLANRPEFRHLHKDGHYIWVRANSTPIFDSDGQIIGSQGTLTDISDRRRLEEEQRRLISILEASTDYISMADRHGTIFWKNAELKRLYGITPGNDVMTYQVSDCHPRWAADRVLQEGIPHAIVHGSWMGETALWNADRQEIPVSQLILSHKSPQGDIEFFSFIMRDIQVRKEYEQKLERTNLELLRATRLKDEFLANMSHELRTPLNAILGMTEGLQEGIFGKLGDQPQKALKTIENSGNHLLGLINDILDLAKIEAGEFQIEPAPTNLSRLCSDSLSFVRQQAIKKHINLGLEIPLHLPQIYIDERRIRQVLINLLNNAVKFTPYQGSVTLTVTLAPETIASRLDSQDSGDLGHSEDADHADLTSIAPTTHILHFAVTDTGIGIAAEHLDRLFQPFIQIDSSLNRQYEGTGLGLSLVKRLVELHGGQVGVTSEVGVGSCFTVALPCSVAIGLEHSPETPWGSTSNPGTAPLILIVEDNEANVITLSSYLEAKGYRLCCANDGENAIVLARSAKPDLILMDIQMPGMDGIQATRKIREDPDLANIPIIALTALAMEGDADRCLSAGANAYVTKPIKLKQLTILMQQFLDSIG